MIELIVLNYQGRLIISDDQISSNSKIEVGHLKGGRRTLSNQMNGFNNFYYDEDRVLIISVVESKGEIELVGQFTKNVKIYLYDRSEMSITRSTNFKTDELEIRHMKGGFNTLVESEPLSWY